MPSASSSNRRASQEVTERRPEPRRLHPPGPLLIAVTITSLFLGGGAAGLGLAAALARDSRLAEFVSFFALPVAFAVGMQAWYGVALLSLVPRLLGRLRGVRPVGARDSRGAAPGLPGAFVFLPISSAAGAVAGVVAALASSSRPGWLVVLVYWLVGTAYGALAWRLARGGFLLPPEST